MFSNLYPPVASGSSTQTEALSRELALRGHRVSIITARIDPDTPEFEEVSGVSIFRIPAIRLPKHSIALNFPWLNYTFTPANIRRIKKIIIQQDPDVFHLHNHMFDLGLSAVRMRKNFKKPMVTTLHTIIRHSNKLYNMVLYPADRIFLNQLVIKNSDQLICPDFNVKMYAAEAFKRAETPIIPYGIDLLGNVNEEQLKVLKEKFGLDNKRVVLSLGHVHDIRNRHELITALPEVLQEFPDTVLLVVGAVSTATPGQLARKLNVEHAVIFAGPLPHQNIPSLLSLADLEAHWLNQDEPENTSLGIASLEAMAFGKTILSAANPETYGNGILKNGDNIILVDPDNSTELAQTIIDLLKDEKKREQIGLCAKETIEENFSWDSICQQTVDVYRQVIKKGNYPFRKPK